MTMPAVSASRTAVLSTPEDHEPMKIKAGMNLTVHPTAANRTVWVGLTDNYIITDSGPGPCILKDPKEIIVI